MGGAILRPQHYLKTFPKSYNEYSRNTGAGAHTLHARVHTYKSLLKFYSVLELSLGFVHSMKIVDVTRHHSLILGFVGGPQKPIRVRYTR